MKYVTILLLLFLPIKTVNAEGDTLTIVHVNDTHSNLSPHGPRLAGTLAGTRGGIARAATFVGMTRLSDPNVLFLHAGDMFMGDLMFNTYFGVPEFVLLQSLGLDAMAVGNHEFDLTPEALRLSLDSAAANGMVFPLLSQNTILEASEVSGLKSYIKPSTVVQKGPITIGIIGLTTPETNFLSLPGPAVIDTPRGEQIYAEIAALKTQGCDVIVALSHLGKDLDQLIAAGVPGIDVIIGGHDHDLLTEPIVVQNPEGDSTYIVQAGAFYEHIGKIRWIVDGEGAHFLDYGVAPLNEDVPEEETIAAVIQGLETGVEQKFGPVFSQKVWETTSGFDELITDLGTRTEARTAVGDLVTRSFQHVGNTDIGLTVGGATAQHIPSGSVVPADLHRMVGYGYNQVDELGFQLARFRLSGADLLMGIEWGLSDVARNDEYFPLGYPLRIRYDASREPYTRIDTVWVGGSIVDSVWIGGTIVNPDSVYSITSSEFVLAVLQGFVAPQLGMTILDPQIMADTTEYEAVLWYLQTHPGYDPSTGIERPSLSNGIPRAIVLDQNFPNPFNPSTTIRFAVPSQKHVRLTVFNLLGQQVAILHDGEVEPGTHEVTWTASVSSGVYLYRLESYDRHSGRTVSNWRRMILLK